MSIKIYKGGSWVTVSQTVNTAIAKADTLSIGQTNTSLSEADKAYYLSFVDVNNPHGARDYEHFYTGAGVTFSAITNDLYLSGSFNLFGTESSGDGDIHSKGGSDGIFAIHNAGAGHLSLNIRDNSNSNLGIASFSGKAGANSQCNISYFRSNVSPQATDTYNLGDSTSLRWNNVYANQYYGDGSNLTCVGGATAWQPDQYENLKAGDNAGAAVDAGTCYNIFIGHEAGRYTKASNAGDTGKGDDNVFVGFMAGNKNTTGSYNIFTGSSSGFCNQTGDANIALGREAGKTVTGSCNIFLGPLAGRCSTGGNHNIFMGYQAGCINGVHEDNIFLGRYSGINVTGMSNVAIGRQALLGGGEDAVPLTGQGNVAIGQGSGKLLQNGAHSHNVFLGHSAGQNQTAGCFNVVIGYNANTACLTEGCQLIIGINANNWLSGDKNYNIKPGKGIIDCTGSCGTTDQVLTSHKVAGTPDNYYVKWATSVSNSTSADKVGIGTTTNEGGDDLQSYYLPFVRDNNPHNSRDYEQLYSDSKLVYDYKASDDSGKVGINTDVLGQELNVFSKAYAGVRLKSSRIASAPLDTMTQIGGLQFADSDHTTFNSGKTMSAIVGTVGGDLILKTGHDATDNGSIDRVTITPIGHVGIGTTNPIADDINTGKKIKDYLETNTNVLAVGIVTAHEYYGNFKGTIDSSAVVVTDKIQASDGTYAQVVDGGTDGHFKVLTEGEQRLLIDNVGKSLFNSDQAQIAQFERKKIDSGDGLWSKIDIKTARNTNEGNKNKSWITFSNISIDEVSAIEYQHPEINSTSGAITGGNNYKFKTWIGNNLGPGTDDIIERIRITGIGSLAVGVGTQPFDPSAALDVRVGNKVGDVAKIQLYNGDQGNTLTQTAEMVLSPDIRGMAGVGISASKENAADWTNISANRDMSLALMNVKNNQKKVQLTIKSNSAWGLPKSNGTINYGTDGQVLKSGGDSASVYWDDESGGSGTGNPAGTNKQVQFNDNNSLAGAENLLFTKSDTSPTLILSSKNDPPSSTNGGYIQVRNPGTTNTDTNAATITSDGGLELKRANQSGPTGGPYIDLKYTASDMDSRIQMDVGDGYIPTGTTAADKFSSITFSTGGGGIYVPTGQPDANPDGKLTEKIRIGRDGEIGIQAGSQVYDASDDKVLNNTRSADDIYGTLGQVLMSRGKGASVYWGNSAADGQANTVESESVSDNTDYILTFIDWDNNAPKNDTSPAYRGLKFDADRNLKYNPSTDLLTAPNLTVTGNITLGDANSDTTIFNSKVKSHIIPHGTSSEDPVSDYSLGEAGAQWNEVHAKTFIGAISGSTDKVQTQSNTDKTDAFITFVAANHPTASDSYLFTNALLKYTSQGSSEKLTIDGSADLGDTITDEISIKGSLTSTLDSDGKGSIVPLINSGVVLAVSLTTGGTGGYVIGSFKTTTGGTGTGLTVEITSIASGGVVNGIILDGAGGSGYTIGDIVTIDGGNNDATVTITDIKGLDFGSSTKYWRKIYAKEYVGKFIGTLTSRNIAMTGDVAWDVNFDGSDNVTSAGTLATVNSSPGTFGSATKVATFSVNEKGLITSALDVDIDFSNETSGTANALKINETDDDSDHYLTFVGDHGVSKDVYMDDELKYNPNKNILTISKFSPDGTAPDADNKVPLSASDGTWSWGTITNTIVSGSNKIVQDNTSAEVIDDGSGTNPTGHFKVITEGKERLRIEKNGRVLIGTDIPSTSNLLIYGQGSKSFTGTITAGQDKITNIILASGSTFPGVDDVITIVSGSNSVAIGSNVKVVNVNIAGAEVTLSASFTGNGTANGASLSANPIDENGQTINKPATIYQNAISGTGYNKGFYVGIDHNDAKGYVWNYENLPIIFATNNNERLQIGNVGQLGIAGANYGTAGQVLKSGGPTGSVVWGSMGDFTSGTTKVATIKDQRVVDGGDDEFDNGGTALAGSNIRALNTIHDPHNIGIALIGQPEVPSVHGFPTVVSVPAGTYSIKWSAPAWNVEVHNTQLQYSTETQFLTASTTKVQGSSEFAATKETMTAAAWVGGDVDKVINHTASSSFGKIASVTFNQTTYVRIVHWCQAGQSKYGLGSANYSDIAGDSIYTQIEIEDLTTAVKEGSGTGINVTKTDDKSVLYLLGVENASGENIANGSVTSGKTLYQKTQNTLFFDSSSDTLRVPKIRGELVGGSSWPGIQGNLTIQVNHLIPSSTTTAATAGQNLGATDKYWSNLYVRKVNADTITGALEVGTDNTQVLYTKTVSSNKVAAGTDNFTFVETTPSDGKNRSILELINSANDGSGGVVKASSKDAKNYVEIHCDGGIEICRTVSDTGGTGGAFLDWKDNDSDDYDVRLQLTTNQAGSVWEEADKGGLLFETGGKENRHMLLTNEGTLGITTSNLGAGAIVNKSARTSGFAPGYSRDSESFVDGKVALDIDGIVMVRRSGDGTNHEGGQITFNSDEDQIAYSVDVYGSTVNNSRLRIVDEKTIPEGETRGTQRFAMNRKGAITFKDISSSDGTDNANDDYGTDGQFLKSQGHENPPVWADLNAANFVTGMIMMFSGATVPSGWKLCDGNNNTPDLRDKFIIGAHSYNSGNGKWQTNVTGTLRQQGGNKNAVLIGHKHTFQVQDGSGGDDGGQIYTSADGDSKARDTAYTGYNTNGVSTPSQSGTNKNLPPYWALAYIMKT